MTTIYVCDCDERSWFGDAHDSACPLSGIPFDLPDYFSTQDAIADANLAEGAYFTVAESRIYQIADTGWRVAIDAEPDYAR